MNLDSEAVTETNSSEDIAGANRQTSQRYEHLAPVVCELAAQPAPVRIQRVLGEMVIRHPAIQASYDYAHWLHYEPRRTRPKGMLVCGPIGNGKSTLGTLIANTLASTTGRNAQEIVSISATGLTTMRGVFGRILETLNGPVTASQRTPDRELAVLRVLRSVGCRMLIIDEVQDIVKRSPAEQRRTLDAFKFLMNELSLSIVALGAERSEQAFAEDPHLSARLKTFHLPAWKNDDVLADFLHTVQMHLPLRRESELSSEAARGYLIKESKGVLDGIMTLVRNAAVHAILSGQERITLEVLQRAQEVPTAKELSGVI